MAVSSRGLSSWTNLDLDSALVSSVTTSASIGGKVKVSSASQLAWRTMGALPLLHHVVVLIEAGISVLYDESIL